MTMTREEAIEILKLQISNAEFFAMYTNNDKDVEKELKHAEAFRMAIEALSAETDSDDSIIGGEKPSIKVDTEESIEQDESKNVDCTDFILWLAGVVIDEKDWWLNAMTYRIFIARRLKKLGLLELKDGHYILPSTETERTWLTEYTEEEAEKEFPNIAKYNTSTDLISRADAIETVKFLPSYREYWKGTRKVLYKKKDIIKALNALPSTEAAQKWIPIKWHEITEEEREREGYPKDWVVHIDCDMPSDGEEILVQTKKGYIGFDICYEEGEFFLDSGWDWIEDIVAWMPRPKPYRKDGEEE